MGCADHRLCGVCHPHRPQRYVLHGNVGKGKKVKKRGASELGAPLFFCNLGASPVGIGASIQNKFLSVLFVYSNIYSIFAAEIKIDHIMTAIAKQILETPMAPYVDILRSMKPQDMRIVVTFLQEAMAEASTPKESAAEIIRKKFKRLEISQETEDLVSDLSLSLEEMADERTRYILGYK